MNGYDAPSVDDVVFASDEERVAAIAAENAYLAEVERELRELAGHISAAQARYLELVAEFDRLKGWAERGYRSAQQWLSITAGASPSTAREQLRVGAALAEFPEAQRALACGELSYDKAAAATKVMTPNNCAELVHMARHAAPADLHSFVSGYLAADRARREEAGLVVDDPTQRYLRAWFDDTGFFCMRARLQPEEGAVVRKALDAAGEALFQASPGDHARRDCDLRAADALVAIAETALASDELPDTSSADRYQVMVTVDAATLGGHGADVALVEDSVALCRRALEHLACDCSVVTLVEADGVPLGVGRKTRSVPAPVRRALRRRDGRCRFPGCGGKRFVDAHHIEHWVAGGATDLANLVTLCRFHHRLVHRAGYRIEMREDGFRFFDPFGAEVTVTQDTADPPGPPLGERHERQGLRIDEETLTRWAGDRMDRHYAVALFMADEPLPASHDPPDTG